MLTSYPGVHMTVSGSLSKNSESNICFDKDLFRFVDYVVKYVDPGYCIVFISHFLRHCS